MVEIESKAAAQRELQSGPVWESGDENTPVKVGPGTTLGHKQKRYPAHGTAVTPGLKVGGSDHSQIPPKDTASSLLLIRSSASPYLSLESCIFQQRMRISNSVRYFRSRTQPQASLLVSLFFNSSYVIFQVMVVTSLTL